MFLMHLLFFSAMAVSLTLSLISLRFWMLSGKSTSGPFSTPKAARKYHRRFCLFMAATMIFLTANSLLTAIIHTRPGHLG